jgi:hypothetical protein
MMSEDDASTALRGRDFDLLQATLMEQLGRCARLENKLVEFQTALARSRAELRIKRLAPAANAHVGLRSNR